MWSLIIELYEIIALFCWVVSAQLFPRLHPAAPISLDLIAVGLFFGAFFQIIMDTWKGDMNDLEQRTQYNSYSIQTIAIFAAISMG